MAQQCVHVLRIILLLLLYYSIHIGNIYNNAIDASVATTRPIAIFFRGTSDRHKVYYVKWRMIRQLYCNAVKKKNSYCPVEYHSSFRHSLHPAVRRIAIMKYKKIASKRHRSGGFFHEFLKDLLGKYGAHLRLGVKYYAIPILYKYIML